MCVCMYIYGVIANHFNKVNCKTANYFKLISELLFKWYRKKTFLCSHPFLRLNFPFFSHILNMGMQKCEHVTNYDSQFHTNC